MADVDAYDYSLPPELIAQQPLRQRSDARLLVVDRTANSLAHRHVRDLGELLRPGDCLVVNDTRVVPARLVGRRVLTGGHWEGLFLGQSAGIWRLLSKTRGKIQPGEAILLTAADGRDAWELRLEARQSDGSWLARPRPAGDVWELLGDVGRVPLPHYIRGGEMRAGDASRYQTVYAVRPGAVAAPTAGLHFTAELLEELARDGIGLAQVTLHVGLGTFRPIAAARLADHVMHSEAGEITAATVAQLLTVRARGGRVVAVGTTTLRVLETASAGGTLQPWQGTTELFIRPPYQFRAVDALLTNFHLPRSTLLVLVRTFGGETLLKKAYAAAIAEGYRFYSYGDAMLIV